MRVEKKDSGKPEKELEAIQPVEHDYEAHSTNPAPSEEAVVEENDEGAGKAMKWVIPVILVALFILWFLLK